MDKNFDIYNDIQSRTNGNIYIGVVGPVRVGKSTFISKFMTSFVMPNIIDKNDKARAQDELPQSSDGVTVMTTQPKFVPNEAVSINVKNLNMKCRMIDCVGFMVEGAMGAEENKKPRMVKTPWSDEKMPFEQAAVVGTQKVISEHSTLGIVMTTDGSFGEIRREKFVEAEQRAIKTMSESGKPFIIILNSSKPTSTETGTLAGHLSIQYAAPVLAIDVANLTEGDVEKVFQNIVTQFPLQCIDIIAPKWMRALSPDNAIMQEMLNEINEKTRHISKIGEFDNNIILFEGSENFEPILSSTINVGKGSIVFELAPKSGLFYKVLSVQSGAQITNDYELVSYIRELTVAKRSYDKLQNALKQVEETGYGIVIPNTNEMELKEPEIIKQGNRSGIRLRASAPSLHIMKVDVETEVSPIMGGEQQSMEMVDYLQREFENNPRGIWNTNMFGKSMESLVSDGLINKVNSVPLNIQNKMRKTMTRIVNEGKGGVICILL